MSSILFKKILSSLLVLIIFLSFSSNLLSQNNQELALPEQKTYPGTVSYPVKRLWEKFREKITSSEKDKANLYKELTLTRLAELNFVVDKKLIGELQTSSERFAFYAGSLTDKLDATGEKNDKQELSKQFDKYIEKLLSMRNSYEKDSSYWMLIEHSINSLKLYKDKLND